MKFIPKNKRYNKIFKIRGKNYSIDHRTITLKFGNIGIKALSPVFLLKNIFPHYK